MTIIKKGILLSLIALSLIIIWIGFGFINCHKAPSKPEMELETATEVTADSLKKPSGTLLSLNKPVVASSEEGSLLAVNAVDGNLSTRWSSVWSDPQWIYVDLGTIHTITGVELNWEAAYGSAYQIQTSDNATDWTTIFTESNGNGDIDEITGLNGSGRYVRMYGIARGTSYGYSLWEFEVYGPTSGSSMEAEAMTLTNYVVNSNTAASGGELIKLSAIGVTGNATYTFTDSTGSYDIEVWYWDENDGECTFRIYVGGTMVDEWVANQSLGSADPVAQTRTSRTKAGVSISTGTQIKLEAVQNNQEWGRFDLVELIASGGPGNQPPTISITSPSDGATFTEGSNITINADASDSDGSVTLVEFFQGSTKLGEDTSSPYSYTWNSVAAGSYSLTAKVTDNGGATTSSTAVNITVNEAPPSGSSMEAENMTLTNYVVNTNSSASGGNLIKLSASGVTGNAAYNFSGTTGTYDVKAWYYDENDGACTFRIYVGGTMVDEWVANQSLGSADPVAQTRTSRTKTGVSIANGAQIKLEAVQNNQEWGRFDLVELTASGGPGNQAPAVSITSPSDGATFTEGDNITINADASDSDGSVTLVEFFQSSTKLGEDASSPYSYTWSNVSAGSYSLTARATDNEGATTTSSAVNITVNVAPGGFPVDLQGATPEEKTVNLDATKPADATDATLEMVVYDPDQANEGTLYINGDVNTITLFGSQGTSANDGATVTVTYNTPASWWNDGANSLRFTHTSTAGYRVESASVTFTTAPPPGDFPVDLQGTTPEEATVSLDVVKEPADATDATLSMVVYDPDQTNEGTLYINGDVNTITLFGSQGVSGNDQQTVTVSYNTLASWWFDGANSLRFTHTSTGGYRVESASVSFSSGPPPPTARWIGEDGSSLADFNSLVGGQAQVHLRFCGWTWNQNFSSAASAITQDAADGGITMWSMQAEVTNAEILSGSYDSYLHTWAADAAADGRKFLLRFNHEMNGDWYEWAYGNDHLGNTPENYAQAWHHVHDIFTQEGATNVKWLFCPNTGYTSTASYPGDAYVDYVGIDGYNWGTTEPWSSWQTFTQIFQTAYNTLTSLTDKPVIICETSCFEQGGNKSDWITSAFLTEIPTSFPEIIGVIWFNEGSFVINTSPEALAAFQNVVANPGWQGTFTLQ